MTNETRLERDQETPSRNQCCRTAAVSTVESLQARIVDLQRQIDCYNRAIAYMNSHPEAEQFLRDLKVNY